MHMLIVPMLTYVFDVHWHETTTLEPARARARSARSIPVYIYISIYDKTYKSPEYEYSYMTCNVPLYDKEY